MILCTVLVIYSIQTQQQARMLRTCVPSCLSLTPPLATADTLSITMAASITISSLLLPA